MEDKVKKILEEMLKINIDDNFSKYSTDKWDSFFHLDLVVKLENEFGISFTPDEIGGMESLKNIVDIINGKI